MTPERLRAKFLQMAKRHAALSRACQAQAVRWTWATSELWDPEPFHFERWNTSPGRPLAQEPKDRFGRFLYGYDGQGRAIAEFQSQGEYGRTEKFFLHAPTRIEWVQYSADASRTLLHYCRVSIRRGRPAGVECHSKSVRRREVYVHRGGLLVAVEGEAQDHGGPIERWREELVHDGGGLSRIIRRWEGDAEEEVVYERREMGEALATLCSVVEDRLVELVPRAVAAARIRDRAYCVALVYNAENEWLPPLLGVGLESERTAWRKKHGEDAESYEWNPAEFRQFAKPALRLRDAALSKACAKLNRELRRQGWWEPARALLVRACRRLNQADWGERLSVTRDFLVYPVDLETADLDQNLEEVREEL